MYIPYTILVFHIGIILLSVRDMNIIIPILCEGGGKYLHN